MAREIRSIAFDIENSADTVILASSKIKKLATELTQAKESPNSVKAGKKASELIQLCSELSNVYRRMDLIIDNLKNM